MVRPDTPDPYLSSHRTRSNTKTTEPVRVTVHDNTTATTPPNAEHDTDQPTATPHHHGGTP